MDSISFWIGLKSVSQLLITSSIGGGGDGKPSSPQ